MGALHATLILAVAMAAGAGSAFAQQPSDCSASPVPDRPLEMSFGSKKVPAMSFAAIYKIGTDLRDGKPVADQYELSVQDKDGFAEIEVELAVTIPAGAQVDGRTFRTGPGRRPQEVLWKVKRDKPSLSVGFVGFAATARVEFGKRRGDVLPGRVYLCIPGGQVEKSFGTKLPDPITLVGRFEAKIRKP